MPDSNPVYAAVTTSQDTMVQATNQSLLSIFKDKSNAKIEFIVFIHENQ
jgi:hypothetical protein